ncbi:MAG: ParB/RepB/Spo0J family partition protein [Alphaproteobacteria bacterium]
MADELPRRGLGRGLDALFGDDYASDAARLDAVRASKAVPIESLTPGPYQPRRRFDDETLAQLAESIARHGLLQPILVRRHRDDPQRYEIVAGERRWRAAQLARLHEVPVVVRDMDDHDTLEVALVENIQRQDLSPLEEADGYRRLIEEFAYTQEALAKALGRSRSHIANTLRLLGLPEPVKKLVDDGRLSAGHARALLGAADPVAMAEQAVARGLTVRDIEKLAARKPKPAAAAPAAPAARDPNIVALERQISDVLGLKVSIIGTTHGHLAVEYRNLDQLDMVINRLTARK